MILNLFYPSKDIQDGWQDLFDISWCFNNQLWLVNIDYDVLVYMYPSLSQYASTNPTPTI